MLARTKWVLEALELGFSDVQNQFFKRLDQFSPPVKTVSYKCIKSNVFGLGLLVSEFPTLGSSRRTWPRCKETDEYSGKRTDNDSESKNSAHTPKHSRN